MELKELKERRVLHFTTELKSWMLRIKIVNTVVKISYMGVVRYKMGSISKEEYVGFDTEAQPIKVSTHMAELIYQPIFLYLLQKQFYDGSKDCTAVFSECTSKDLLVFDDVSINELQINRLAYKRYDENGNKLKKNNACGYQRI